MAAERVSPTSSQLATQSTTLEQRPKTEKELYHQILTSAKLGKPHGRRDFQKDIRWYCELKSVRIVASSAERPNPSIPLIITPNHYSQRLYSKTSEAFKDVVVTSLACYDQGLSKNHTVWFIKRLPIYPAGLGMLVRKVQNASVVTYGSIPVEVRNGSIANRNEMTEQYLEARQRGDNIGFFPEQKPTRALQRYHPDYITFLQFLRRLYPQGYQILPAAIFNEGKQTHVNFGNIIHVNSDIDERNVADQTLQIIAQNLPAGLRGPWG